MARICKRLLAVICLLLIAAFVLSSCSLLGESANAVVNIEKTGTEGNVDTYTIYYLNGEEKTFTVTHGADGKDGINGAPGKDGKAPEVSIGENGNWFVDGIETGIKALASDGKDGKDGKDGADGITPLFKLENGELMVSYDNGVTWASLGYIGGSNEGEEDMSADDLRALLAAGGNVVLANDVVITGDNAGDKNIVAEDGTKVDFADKSIILAMDGTGANWMGLWIDGANGVVITGTEGGITVTEANKDNPEIYGIVVENSTGATKEVTISGGNYVVGGQVVYLRGSNITCNITGGYFKSNFADAVYYAGLYPVLNAKNNQNNKFVITGGTFVNFDISAAGLADTCAKLGGDVIEIPDTHKVKVEVQANGDVWYTVVSDTSDDVQYIIPVFKLENGYLKVSYDDGATWITLGYVQGAPGQNGANGAPGQNGVDGKTPVLKLENGELMVSYDNGVTWASLGYIGGSNEGEEDMSAEDLRALLAAGGNVVLTNDVVITGGNASDINIVAEDGTKVDYADKSIILAMDGRGSNWMGLRVNGAKDVVITGNEGGIIVTEENKDNPEIYGIVVENAAGAEAITVTISGGKYIVGGQALYLRGSNITCNITGGFFQSLTQDAVNFGAAVYPVLNAKDNQNNKFVITGGTFVNFDPRTPLGSDVIEIPDTHEVKAETQANGDVWYTVVGKANMSADQQAISAMNEYLAIAEGEDKAPDDLDAVKKILAENKFDISKAAPLADAMTFFWVKDINRIVYVDESTGEVVFPKEYAGRKFDIANDAGKWFTLDGRIAEEKYTVSEGVVEITTGEQLYKLMKDYAKATTTDIVKVVLKNDVDLKGAGANFGTIENKTLEIDGGNHKIYGIRVCEPVYSMYNKPYACGGLIASVNDGAVVAVKNLEIVDAYVSTKGIDGAGNVGILAGNVTSSTNSSVTAGKLSVENVTITRGYVHGEKSIGALIGYLEASESNTPSFKDVTVNLTIVEGGERSAAIIGVINEQDFNKNGNVDYVTYENIDASNVSVRHITSYGSEIAANGKTAEGVGVVTEKDFWFFERNQKKESVAKNFD